MDVTQKTRKCGLLAQFDPLQPQKLEVSAASGMSADATLKTRKIGRFVRCAPRH
jgi:hypothetical protein